MVSPIRGRRGCARDAGDPGRTTGPPIIERRRLIGLLDSVAARGAERRRLKVVIEGNDAA